MPNSEAAVLVLLYFILPLWLAAGFADYLCHRASSIELTTGYKESLIHLLMFFHLLMFLFSEVAVPLLAAIFFEINALVIALMIAGFIAHQLTALWDVSLATDKRYVSPIEQQIHSLLEVLPLAGMLIVIILNWPQFLSLWGLGAETPRFRIALKPDPLPWTYVVAFLSAVLVFEVLPYLEELVRAWRSRKRTGAADGRGS
jgi:hypothetical protein